jgi:uncharacterized membrane protein
MPNLLLAIANYLHLLATIVWIGGLVISRLIIAPALAPLPAETRRIVLHTIGQRAASFTYGAIGVFIISGLAMLSKNANYSGLVAFDNLWTRVILLKHLTVAGLILSTAYVNSSVTPKLQAAGDDAERARWAERRKDLGDVNVLLALVILALTAIATAIPPAG